MVANPAVQLYSMVQGGRLLWRQLTLHAASVSRGQHTQPIQPMAATLIITFAEASSTNTGFLPCPQDLQSSSANKEAAYLQPTFQHSVKHTHTHTHTYTHLRPQVQIFSDNESRGLAGALQLDGDA